MPRVWLRKPRSPHEYGAAKVLLGGELLKVGVYTNFDVFARVFFRTLDLIPLTFSSPQVDTQAYRTGDEQHPVAGDATGEDHGGGHQLPEEGGEAR